MPEMMEKMPSDGAMSEEMGGEEMAAPMPKFPGVDIDAAHKAEQAATVNPQLTVHSPVKWSDLPQSERDACMIRVRDRDERNQSNGEDKQPKPRGMMVDLDSLPFSNDKGPLK